MKNTTISSKSLRAERRTKSIKNFLTHGIDILKIGLGIVVGLGMFWVLQVLIPLIWQ